MLVNKQDNQKIPLENLLAYIINSNSKVYIALNNVTSTIVTNSSTELVEELHVDYNSIATITINRGNTVSNLASSLLYYTKTQTSLPLINYDIVYGNSSLLASSKDFERSKHEYLIDYNFPAAKYTVNGYKNAYAILLNNGTSAFWTDLNKGILFGDIVVNSIHTIPTRMNGYTATIHTLNANLIEHKYNGSIVISSFEQPLTADFVYNLLLDAKDFKSPNVNTILKFNNLNYLFIRSGITSADVLLRNVRYSLFDTTQAIISKNSNIAVNNISQISPSSYNTIAAYNPLSFEYRDYLLSGVQITNNLINKNILFNRDKLLKQTLHAIDSVNGYRSNLPVGAILWYPLVWSAFSPAYDKNTPNESVLIMSRGLPDTKDWMLCDGSTVPTNSLYYQYYNLSKTPNYKVELRFYKDQPASVTGYHYLTLASIIQFLPSTVVEATPTWLGVQRGLAGQEDDNKHKYNQIWVRQNLSGAYDLQMKVKGNWRAEGIVNVHFKINFGNMNLDTTNLISNWSLDFNSYCCGTSKWWGCWTGGNIAALTAQNALPSTTVDGQTYLAGYPIDQVTGTSNANGKVWMDTVNCPKMAVRLNGYDLASFPLEIKCISGDQNKLFNDTSKTKRVYYNGNHSVVKHMRLLVNNDGGDDYTPCTDCIKTPLLPYHLKTYRIKFKETASPPDILLFDLQFQLGLPAACGFWRCKGGSDAVTQYWERWFGVRNRDNTLNGAPYHTFVQADYMTMFSELTMNYGDIKLRVVPIEKGSYKLATASWNNEDWPSVNNKKSISGKFKDIPYRNFGLYRRLNPYIKINDNNLKKVMPIDNTMLIKVYNNPVSLIKVRNNKFIGNTTIAALNTDTIKNNTLSACYIPSGNKWSTLNNSIALFAYIIEKNDLTDLYTKQEDAVILSCGTRSIKCNTYYDNSDITNEYIYFEILNSGKFEDLFESVTCTLYDLNGQSLNKTLKRYKDLDLTISKLNTYYNIDYYNTTTKAPDIQYTYYSITRDGDNYKLLTNPTLIQLATNYKLIDHAIRAINTTLYLDSTCSHSGYIGTCSCSLPVFYTDYDNNNKPLHLAEVDTDDIINDGAKIKLYPFLGSPTKVMSATAAVTSYVYSVTITNNLLSGKFGNYNKTSTYIENNKGNQNVIYTLTSPILSANTSLKLGNTYIFTTSGLSITKDEANIEIYNRMRRVVSKISNSLNKCHTIDNLSSTLYSVFLNTIPRTFNSPVSNITNVKVLSGL